MPEKSRIKNLSTRFLLTYKIFIWTLLLAILSALIYSTLKILSSLIFTSSWIFILYKYYQMNNKLYQVEFDEEFLYVIQKKADLVVPLENVKDVNLKTLIGHYEIIFYNAEQLGDKIYFKPSLLYPFNSKKKDELVNVLWSNIERAKRKKQDFRKNALHS